MPSSFYRPPWPGLRVLRTESWLVSCSTETERGGPCGDVFFFFQAEDGIRDIGVTGVQTCALPISYVVDRVVERETLTAVRGRLVDTRTERKQRTVWVVDLGEPRDFDDITLEIREIGRASCRERVEISVVAVSLKKKKMKSGACSRV